MATTLALAMRASMSASGVVSGANQAAGALDKMAKHAQKTAQGMSVLQNVAVGAVIARGISAVSDALMSAGRSAFDYAAGVARSVDALNDLSERTGIAVESLQVLQMAAKLSGVDDVTTAVQKLAVAIGNAAESGNTDAFTRLGLNFAELQAMSPEAQFRAIQAAIAALPTPAERAAAAVAIFGRAGVELLPMMNQNLEKIEERMRRLGAIVSEEQVGAVGEMNDALDMVRATFDGIIGQVVGNLAPVVTAMAETFLEFVEGYKGVSGEGGTGIANAITKGLLAVLEGLAKIVDGAVSGFTRIANVFERISGMLWTITKAFAPVLALQLSGLDAGAQALMNGEGVAGGAGATEFIQGLRQDFENSQTPEAKAAREERQKQREQEQKDAAKAAQDATDKAAQEAKLKEDAKKVTEGTRTAEEKHAEEMKRLNELRAGNFIDEQTYERAKAEADKKLQDEHEKSQQEAMKVLEDQKKMWEAAAAIDEKMAGKQAEIDKIEAERAFALNSKSNEALKANDIRSSEGMAAFIALATGREDPAIEEARKTNQKLDELRKELQALDIEKVEILGAAA